MTVSINTRTQLLFDYVYPAAHGPYSTEQVASSISVNDVTISAAELQDILDGTAPDPAFRTLTAIADFFKVPIDYFSTTNEVVWHSYETWIKEMRKRADDASLYAARTNRWHEIRAKRRRRGRRGR